MVDNQNLPQVTTGPIIHRLVRETGITEEQARDLVSMLGFNWGSLVREARFLIPKR
jgi:hypothetical protein